MCLSKLRMIGQKFQAKYENLIAKRSLYGFSDLYMKSMDKINKRKDKEVS